MDQKNLIRNKYFLKRQKNYSVIKKNFFFPLIPLFKKLKKKYISIYYPNSYEINVLKILEIDYFKRFKNEIPHSRKMY